WSFSIDYMGASKGPPTLRMLGTLRRSRGARLIRMGASTWPPNPRRSGVCQAAVRQIGVNGRLGARVLLSKQSISLSLRRMDMKLTGMVITTSLVAALAATPALAEDAHRDRQDIRHDRRDLRQDRRDVRRDTRDIRQDRRDLRQDRRELRRDVRQGDTPGAQA